MKMTTFLGNIVQELGLQVRTFSHVWPQNPSLLNILLGLHWSKKQQVVALHFDTNGVNNYNMSPFQKYVMFRKVAVPQAAMFVFYMFNMKRQFEFLRKSAYL